MDAKKLPLSIGILTYNSPDTLKHTLLSYFKNGLLDLTDDIICIIQPSNKSSEEIDICNKYNINYLLEPFNTLMAGGIKRIWETAKYDYVLFLECDFYLSASKEDTANLLSLGIKYLQENTFDIIRLRSLKHPGHPIQGKTSHESIMKEPPLVQDLHTQLYLVTHFLENPHEVFPAQITKFLDNPLIYSITNKNCVYTNNPHIINRTFYNNFIKPLVKVGRTLESEIDVLWAVQNNHKIAITNGLFTHNRIDGHNGCECCLTKYGGISDKCKFGCCPSTIQMMTTL